MLDSISVVEKKKAGNGGMSPRGESRHWYFHRVAREGHSDKVTFESNPKRRDGGIHIYIFLGTAIQAERQACAKALEQFYAWYVQGIARRLM